MSRIILVTGGTRSGKSRYALNLAESLPGPRAFIATCPVTDDEMKRRIEAHRRERESAGWTTIEEETDLAGAMAGAKAYSVIVVDCLTLWINNLMYTAEADGREPSETDIARLTGDLVQSCGHLAGTVIFVTNEVGMGIVPEHRSARLFRDLVGRCSQIIAANADAVVFIVCGVPMTIKGDEIS